MITFNDALRQLFIDFKYSRRGLGDTMRLAKEIYYGTPGWEDHFEQARKETNEEKTEE